jgi:hypothetical protein
MASDDALTEFSSSFDVLVLPNEIAVLAPPLMQRRVNGLILPAHAPRPRERPTRRDETYPSFACSRLPNSGCMCSHRPRRRAGEMPWSSGNAQRWPANPNPNPVVSCNGDPCASPSVHPVQFPGRQGPDQRAPDGRATRRVSTDGVVNSCDCRCEGPGGSCLFPSVTRAGMGASIPSGNPPNGDGGSAAARRRRVGFQSNQVDCALLADS